MKKYIIDLREKEITDEVIVSEYEKANWANIPIEGRVYYINQNQLKDFKKLSNFIEVPKSIYGVPIEIYE